MDISLSELSKIFTCDPKAGILYWQSRARSEFNSEFTYKMWNKQYEGKPAGGIGRDGYIVAHYYGRTIIVHRAVWMFAHGDIPPNLYMDHINHIRSDNRLANLRLVTHHQNQKNQSMHCTNISGVNGVRYDRNRKKWIATIRHNNESIHLGSFDEMDEAVAVRKLADGRFSFHQNHGKDRHIDTPYIDPWNRIK